MASSCTLCSPTAILWPLEKSNETIRYWQLKKTLYSRAIYTRKVIRGLNKTRTGPFIWARLTLYIQSVFTWRHGGHIAVPCWPSGNWTLFLCKYFLLFNQSNMTAGHVSENALSTCPVVLAPEVCIYQLTPDCFSDRLSFISSPTNYIIWKDCQDL